MWAIVLLVVAHHTVIWLCCIVTNKLLEDKQEKIKALQMEIKSLNIEIMTRGERGINQLEENMKGKKNRKCYDMSLQAYRWYTKST